MKYLLILMLAGCTTASKTETETLGWWCVGICAGAEHEQEIQIEKRDNPGVSDDSRLRQ